MFKDLKLAYKLWRAWRKLRSGLREVNVSEKLKSRKFWVAVVGGLILLVNKALGSPIDEATATQLVALVGSYVIGQGIADFRNGS
jgi:hypothetical protein